MGPWSSPPLKENFDLRQSGLVNLILFGRKAVRFFLEGGASPVAVGLFFVAAFSDNALDVGAFF